MNLIQLAHDHPALALRVLAVVFWTAVLVPVTFLIWGVWHYLLTGRLLMAVAVAAVLVVCGACVFALLDADPK
jgi:hypothetical protein